MDIIREKQFLGSNSVAFDNKNPDEIVSMVKDVLYQESDALRSVATSIDVQICRCIDLIVQSRGRVIFTGVGKMGYVGRKAAATFCSTGAPAIFLHAGEAAHGDLGIVTSEDVVIALSYSGQSDEVLGLMPYMQRFNIPVISITGNLESQLARLSQYVINVQVDSNPEYLVAPTSSTTVALAVCDALAVTVARLRGFTNEQFAIFHPGGNLGRKLLTTVKSLMHKGEDIPVVEGSTKLRDGIVTMSQKRLGAILVADASGELKGILTDGDIRRVMQNEQNPLDDRIDRFMTCSAQTTHMESLAAEALNQMQQNKISVLPVVDEGGKIVGVIHLHDLLNAGLA